MVDFLPEDLEAMRKSRLKMEEMSQVDREICAADTPTHLVIPMNDIYNLRRIADLLRGLASDFDVLSRRHDIRPRSIIMDARAAVRYANKRIREMKEGYRHPWERERQGDLLRDVLPKEKSKQEAFIFTSPTPAAAVRE